MANSNLVLFQDLKISKDKFDNQCIYMKIILGAYDVWDVIENGYIILDNVKMLTQA